MADSGLDTVPPLNLVFTTKEFNLFVDNLLTGKSQHVIPFPSTPSATQEKPSVEAESSSTTSPLSAYLNLPHHLKSCLDYSYFVLSNSAGCHKERLACLLLAEGLIKQDNSSTLDEDAASSAIDELIGLGMLEKHHRIMEWVRIPHTYKKLCIRKMDRNFFFAKASDLAIRLYILDGEINYLYPNLCSLTITSLFDGRRKSYDKCISRAYMETICKLKSLAVLDLNGYIECLPDEIGNLVHLKYLRLSYSKLKSFVSFEMMFCHVNELPGEVLDIQRLWHLMINRNTFNSKVEVHRKIGLRLNLFTLTRIDARGEIRNELSKFTQLRRIEIYCVSEEHATELCAAIMKMTYLFSLTLEAGKTAIMNSVGNKKEVVALFPELEAFSPPSRLQNVNLKGQLVDIPGWLLSMENLSSLTLRNSYLHDDSIFLLQFLPNLKYLELNNASRSKQIGEEFCQAGGFPKLEKLLIRSTFLVEWTEIANGAFPSLRSLNFVYCGNLMFLPNGLRNITTLDELCVYRIHGDLERRLQGIENYKINNISEVFLYTFY